MTWTQTNFGPIGADGSEPTAKFFGPYMAVDPINDLICFAATPSNGVYFTVDGGSNWTHISTGTLPTGVPLGRLIPTGNQIGI